MSGHRANSRRSFAVTAWLPLLFILLLPVEALALDPEKRFDDYVLDTWSIEEGLPQITVRAIAQDPEKYLWVGTQAGLARFDGVHFEAFDLDNTPALPGLMIHDLFLDSRDRMWVATYKGVAVYENGVFTRLPFFDVDDEEVRIDARTITEDANGEIFVSSVEGLFQVGDKELLRVPRLREGAAYGLLAEREGLWVGGAGKVTFLAVDGRTEERRLPDGMESTLVNRLVRSNERLWAGTSTGLLHWTDGRWQRFTEGRDSLRALPVTALHEDIDRNLWVATSDGLARLRDGRQVEFVANDMEQAFPQVRTIFEDHEGNLWLGSHWHGVARLWNGWTDRYSTADGLQDPLVWSIARGSKGELWIGTSEGLEVMRDGRIEKVLEDHELPHPHAYTLLDDGERLWIGTRTGLVWYRNGRVETPDVFSTLATTQVSGVVQDRDGNYWIASDSGLYRYRDNQLSLVPSTATEGVLRVRLVHETRNGRLLVGTLSGLYEVIRDRLRHIGRDAGLPEGLDITAITELDDGSIVAGTLTEQLFLYEAGLWHEFTAETGLPLNSPFFLGTDSKGYLWVAGIRGLYRVPVEDLRQHRIGKLETVRGEMLLSERGDVRGAQKTYCCNGAGNAKGFIEDDVLWLPTRGGVASVDTRDIVKNPVPPNIVIEEIRSADQRWNTIHGDGERLELPAEARDLSFRFTALSLQEPRSVLLKYRLVGYDDEWVMMDRVRERTASYTNLPPGNYRLEVSGTNNAGVWATENAVVEFNIAPRYWETTWFMLLLVALALLLVYAGYRFQLHNLTVQRTRLEKTVRRRTEELRLANNQLRDAVQTDSLTGLHNRRFVQKQLPGDLAFYERNVAEPEHRKDMLVFAFTDIDHLRRINEDHGPHVGDAVLRQFGKLLGQYTRAGDYVVRWEGEKFLMVFRPMESGVFDRIAERLRAAIQNHEFNIEGSGTLNLTASIGFMEMPLDRVKRDPLQWEDFIELADHALYYVKSTGRNGWATFRMTETTRVETLVDEVRLHLRALVDNGDLKVFANHGRKAPS